MNSQILGDKAAISLSIICVIHCLLLPLLVLILPSMATLWFNDETFHQWLLLAVFMSSSFALSKGYRQHKQFSIILWGSFGLSFLFLASLLGHDKVGELGEQSLTLIGAFIIAIGHIKNYRTCKQHQCEC
ncbi:MAG: MerC domain-containing protein [Kangiellaceae bacterium]|nr:MerC domain-containing protein [Kangiellaceae bacterium]MCW9018043.1 MerC domain-containing protein [Kangiellaceae bacterium]